MRPAISTFFLATALALTTGTAIAQEAAEPAEGGLKLDLNTLQQNDSGCLMTFVAENAMEHSLQKAAYEVVFFNGEGLVERMTVLDFQDLPAGRTRVRQFNLPDMQCDNVSRVLINDVSACEGAGVEPATCLEGLSLSSKSEIEFTN